MSNEELAVRIKAGERERLLELWMQVKDLVAWYAVRRYNAAPGLGGVEVDDLIQSGFIAMVEAVERRIWLEQLRAALDKAVYDLPGEWPELIDRHYYLGESLQQTADAMGWTRHEVHSQTGKAITALRRNVNRNGLAGFYEKRALDLKTPWYLHVGVEAFASTGTSSVEKIVLQRERDRECPERLTEYVDAVQKSIERDRAELAALAGARA